MYLIMAALSGQMELSLKNSPSRHCKFHIQIRNKLQIPSLPRRKPSNKRKRTVSPKALKICTENINSCYKTKFANFDQNTAELYDNYILATMICIFWP